jgi:catechol 2,3-dioxygenase-like lactoylglutathione lyase family enzyme
MNRLWTIIGVGDVARSYEWYRALLGLPASEPAHSYFGQLCEADGTVLLCVHAWGEHDHATLVSPDVATPGNGLVLFFRVDDLEAAVARARAAGLTLEHEPRLNPGTRTLEISLRDPDGYLVMLSAS